MPETASRPTLERSGDTDAGPAETSRRRGTLVAALTPRVRRRSLRELIGGTAAIFAPAVMWTEFLGFGLSTPGYSIVTRAASDLGARDARNAAAFVIGFFYVAGILTVTLGASLALDRRASRTWRLGAGLVVLEGILLAFAGAFPANLAGTGGGSPHQLLSTACFAAAALAPAVLAAGATPAAVPPVLRGLWLIAGGALLLLLAGATVTRAVVPFPDGLFQRPFGLVLTGWFAATGLWLLHGADPDA